MADARLAMEARLMAASLWRKRGAVSLAALAVAIGGSVAAALLHVSGEVERKLTLELRSLGPNLLVVPSEVAPEPGAAPGAAGGYLEESVLRAGLDAAGLDGVPVLYVVARIGPTPVQVIGADLEGARRLHPSWRVASGAHASLMGARLQRRLGVREGAPLTLEVAGTGRVLTLPAGAALGAGGADDEAWWIPLAQAQALAGLEGKVSLAQARLAPGPGAAGEARRVAAVLERGGRMRALPLHALSATEAGLLDRMKRLMALVTIAALAAAGLCAFGTLTDLALERRREIALLKALGASRRRLVLRFVAESLAIGAAGGILGWMIGLGFAEVIGREVFHSAIAVRWSVPVAVVALSAAVAALAGLGPIRLALAVEPALELKGD